MDRSCCQRYQETGNTTNRENIFFLFNPFDRVVLTVFLNHFGESVHKWPRKVWLIYNHPVCNDVIESYGSLMKIGEYHYGVSKFLVYSNRHQTKIDERSGS